MCGIEGLLKKSLVRNTADFVKSVRGKTKVSILHDGKKPKQTSLLWEKLATAKGTQQIHFVETLKNATTDQTGFAQRICVSFSKQWWQRFILPVAENEKLQCGH